MATYAFQQNFTSGGASAGYVKFNASPDLGTPVAPGEQITFEGEVYSRDYAIASMSLSLYDASFSNWIYPSANFSVSAKKATKTAFKIVLTMPGAADWFPADRTVPLAFQFGVARADGSGDVLTPTATQQLTWLRYRIKPVINAANFLRYGYNEDSAVYEPQNDGAYCLARGKDDGVGLKISLASGYTASDITTARITITTGTAQSVKYLSASVLTNALSASGYTEVELGLFADMTFDPGFNHVLLIEIGDAYDVAVGKTTLPRSFANMCLCNFKTGGVSFGGFPKSTEGKALFESYYPMMQYENASFYGGLANVQAGYIDALGSTASGSYKDGTVTFPKAFAAGTVPVVVIGFQYTSTAGSPGDMSVAVVSAGNTGFTFRFYNGNSSSRNPAYSYIAFGIPA